MIFKPLLSKILPKAPKNRLIFTLIAALLVNLALGLCFVIWQQHVYEKNLGVAEARKYDISLAFAYIFVTSVTFYALQDWVFADGEGCYTLHLASDSDKTWITLWLVRFSSFPSFCLNCLWMNYSVLTVTSWNEIQDRYMGAFLSGTLFVLIDLAVELKGCNPQIFIHHIFSAIAILLSAEWGHFEPAILLFGIQLAMDKVVWPIFFFSRLMIMRDRVLSEMKVEEGGQISEALQQKLKKGEQTVDLLLACGSSGAILPSSSSIMVTSSTAVTSGPSSTVNNEPFDLPNPVDISTTASQPEEEEEEGQEVAVPTTTAIDIDLAPQETKQEEVSSSSSTTDSYGVITIPDEAVFKKLQVLQRYRESQKKKQDNGGDSSSSWYVDDLIPSRATMSYLYSAMFVYYVLLVRGLTIGCLVVYLFRFWDHVELPWKILLPFAGFCFVAVDVTVYHQIWLRSHWGRVGRQRK